MFKKPSWRALVLALVPFLAMCFSVSLWDRVEPMLLGLPFNLFWLICWIMLTTLCLWIAYRLEAAKGDAGSPPAQEKSHSDGQGGAAP